MKRYQSKTMNKILTISACVLMMVVTLTSCHYKDFDEYPGNVPVKFVFSYDSLEFKPGMMRMLICPKEGQFTEPLVNDFRDSTTVSIPLGSYRVVSYSNDSEILRSSRANDQDGNLLITTGLADRTKFHVPDSLASWEFYDYPDRVAAYIDDSVSIVWNDERTLLSDNTFLLIPHEITKSVTIEIDGMRGMQWLTGVTFSLDGCNTDYYPAADSPGKETGSIVCSDASVNFKDSVITTQFHIFGLPKTQGNTLHLFLSGNGFSHTLWFDIDGKVQYLNNHGDMLIRLTTDFDVRSVAPHNNFDVGIDEWRTDSVDIKM